MFEIGTVLRIFAEDSIPPKVKYCIIVGSSRDKIATVFINSDLRPPLLKSYIQSLQYPLNHEDCSCLKYESYVDCAQISERDKSQVNAILQKEPGRKECVLAATHVQTIVDLIKRSKTISIVDKRKFGLI